MLKVYFFNLKDGQILECSGEHEHYSETTRCCPDICTPVERPCGCLPINRPSCQCDGGYNRDPKTGKCTICLLRG